MHVVMILAGAAKHDTRVMREAAWLTRAGLEVTILARSLSGRVEYADVEGAELIRVPIDNRMQEAQIRRQLRMRHLGRIPLTSRLESSRETNDLRRMARRQGDELRVERHPLLGYLQVKGRNGVIRYGRRAQRQADLALHRVWTTVDERLKDVSTGASWRRSLLGRVDDLELGFGPLLDYLEPDAIHAHDMHVLGVAVHAARRARTQGREVKVVYDSHEYVRGMALFGNSTKRSNAAWADLESEYIPYADEVIAVSPHLGEFMREDHDLPRSPTILMNVPVPQEDVGEGIEPVPSLRARCGIGPEVPLGVYSGVLRGVRGVDDVVMALARVPELHVAIVSVPTAHTPQAHATMELAESAGVADRVHIVDAVPASQVTRYLSEADLGVIPIRGGWTSYDYCLPNKFFECLEAGLPLVVSDLPTMAGFVAADGLGATFTPRDPDSLAVALRTVLDDLPGFRRAVEASTVRREGDWRRQEALLRSVYERLLGVRLRPEGDGLDHRPLHLRESEPVSRRRPTDVLSIGIGPTNRDGWGTRLAVALRALRPTADVAVTAVNRRRSDPHAEIAVSRSDYESSSWQISRSLAMRREMTHAVWEDGEPLGGDFNSPTCVDEARMLVSQGGGGLIWLHRAPTDALLAHLGELTKLGVPLVTSSGSPAADVEGVTVVDSDVDHDIAARLVEILDI